MNESTVTDRLEHTWEEPRGPRLPDALSRVPLLAWPLLVQAALTVWLQFELLRSQTSVPPLDLAFAAVVALIPVVTPLLGVALLLRHPNAWSRWPYLLFGLLLLAALQVLELAGPVVRPWLDTLAPGNPDEFLPGPVARALPIIQTLLGACAFLYVAHGLRGARRRPGRPGGRAVAGLIAAFAFAIPALGLASVLAVQDLTLAPFPDVPVTFAAQTVLSLATAYCALVLINGVRAGEAPRTAWWLASFGVVLPMAINGLISLLVVANLATSPTELMVLPPALYGAVSMLIAAGWILLLVAFALGLPDDSLAESASP